MTAKCVEGMSYLGDTLNECPSSFFLLHLLRTPYDVSRGMGGRTTTSRTTTTTTTTTVIFFKPR